MRGRRLALGLTAGVLALTGCGGGSDEDDIQSVVKDFSSALLDTDGAATCELLTDNAIKELTGGDSREDCEKVIDEADEPSDDDREQLEDPEVTDLEVDGSTATASVKTKGDDDPSRTRFKKQDGDWKIDGEE